MKSWPLALLAAPLAAALSSSAAEIPFRGHTFTLPDGFTIELAAGPDLVPRPIAGSFDPQGRLYVTDSSGSNLPPAEQLKDPQSRILRLEDTDGDGRFDRSTVFAEHVMFPQGCLWFGGSVYVAGPPSIWKFTDTDGDGVADERTEWYQGNVLTGCANDVHGPYLGPEGKFYWTKGAFARLDLKDGRGRPIQDRCAHIFRAWPDGSDLEVVISGGMDNPVEVAFTAEGEPMVISTFIDLSQPGRRDGLAHAVYGGVFGKRQDAVNEPMVRRTGELLPALVQFGPAAACALMRYEGDAFGPAYRDNLFATLFNLRKVTRHILQPSGATYRTEDQDFLVSDQIDFRPTDVFQDVDGSLLVVDTGGWYKLCCPSSQLAKADVLGAIYRVRRAATNGAAGGAVLTPEQRRLAYTRLIQPPRLRDASREVVLKRAALKAAPSSSESFLLALAALKTGDPARPAEELVRQARLAAEGLGRLREPSAVPALFDALALNAGGDRFLEHSLLYALIEIDDPAAVRPFLESGDLQVQRAALLVLEQVGDGKALAAADILPVLNAAVPNLRDTAQWVARRHSEWAGAFVEHFEARLSAPGASAEEKASWEGLLDLLMRQPEGQQFLARAAAEGRFRTETRIAALHAMAKSGAKEVLPAWRSAILGSLQPSGSLASTPHADALSTAAVQAARALSLPKADDAELTGALRSVVRRSENPLSLRLEALGALPAGAPINDDEFAVVLSALDPERSPIDRLAAAQAIARLTPTAAQLARLTTPVREAGPLELQRLLGAFSVGGDAGLGQQLLGALKESKALRSLRPEDLRPHLAKFPATVQEGVEALIAAQQVDALQQGARLDSLLAELQGLQGSIRSGQTLFNSARTACSTCHRMGYLGGDIGPDLTSIGTVRSERDLLEAVLYPSASLVRSYEPWIAETRDHEEYSGVLRRDTPDEVVLATGPGAEVRLARADIVQLRPGGLSVMPAGLEEQLTRQELADLLAFLKNTKWGVN